MTLAKYLRYFKSWKKNKADIASELYHYQRDIYINIESNSIFP